MKLKNEHVERVLWIIAFGLALLLRLLKLGSAPLTDWEASHAIQVFDWLKSGALPTGTQPGYTLSTGLLFYIFGSANFAARLIPAIFGSFLVLVPVLFRKQLGRGAVLIAAFGLAIDPALVAVSRLADGATWSMAFTLFSLGLLLNRKYTLTGIALGLALLGGPTLWMGWLGLGAAVLAGGQFAQHQGAELGGDEITRQSAARKVLISALITLAAAGTLFGFAPFGLSMAAGSLPAFFQRPPYGGTLPLQVAVIALLTYGLLPLVLGIIRSVVGWKQRKPFDQLLSFWWLAALLLWLAWPGRQLSNVGWMMLPMWALAARQTASWFEKPAADARFSGATAVIVFVLVFFIILNSVGILHPAGWSANTDLQIVKIVVATAIMALIVVLVGWGWSWNSAWHGLRWGWGTALMLMLVSMSLNAAGLSKQPQGEIWRSGEYFLDADLLEETLQDLSMYQSGQPNQLQTTVVGIQSPSLQWLLRETDEVQYTDSISAGEIPDIILSSDQIQPGQTSTYRGQDFYWSARPAWEQMDSVSWFKWLVFREYPKISARMILWARTDLFPGQNVDTVIP